ncbi:MAG: hypothetical protein AAF628_31785 [Planctomycetota bacterium]
MTHETGSPGAWEEQEFPAEDEWLGLPCPPVSADFVERTLGRVQDEQRQDHERLSGLVDAWQAPEPSADFVDRTSRELTRSRSPEWQRFLARHAVPTPSPDFVERVLDALQQHREVAPPVTEAQTADAPMATPRPRPRRTAGRSSARATKGPRRAVAAPAPRPWARRAGLVFAAAAALALAGYGVVALLSSESKVATPLRVVAAQTFAPDPFGVALAALGNGGLGVAPDDPLLAAAAARAPRDPGAGD